METVKLFGDSKCEKINKRSFDRLMNYIKNIEENLDAGKGLVLCGSLGLGKTRAISFIGRKVIEAFFSQHIIEKKRQKSVLFVLASSIPDYVFPYSLDDKDIALRKRLFSADVLFIDDITKLSGFKSGAELVFLDRIIRDRYHNNLPVFITSQVPFDKLGDILSEPILDILYETCENIVFVGESWRRK